MIKRSLLVAAVLLVLYQLVLPHLPRGAFRVPGQQRGNYLRAQRYVQDVPADLPVVVGSSMANELSDAVLGDGYYKLTFPGGSLATGLELIRQTGRRPRRLLIESNELLREPDAELLSDVLSGWRRHVRREFTSFEEAGRPSDYVIGYLSIRLRHTLARFDRISRPATPATPDAGGRTLDPVVFARVMEMNRRALDRAPAPAELMRRLQRVGEIVDALRRDGCQCVFFEMPIDRSLADLPEPRTVRKIMHARFPVPQYRWVNFTHPESLHTVDGIHLTSADAETVTRELVSSRGALARTD